MQSLLHAVGPRCNEAPIDHTFEKILMQNTFIAILKLDIKNDYKSVSIPAISTEVFKFPLASFAVTCIKTIKEFINNHEKHMENRKVILCNFNEYITNKLLKIVPKVLESEEETKNIKQSKSKSKNSYNK